MTPPMFVLNTHMFAAVFPDFGIGASKKLPEILPALRKYF
jgi:hypothetical protein